MESTKSPAPAITITITGAAGAGKTTLAIALQRFLDSQGFTEHTVSDADVMLGSDYPELQERRMQALKHQTIAIVTKPTGRFGCPHKDCNRPSTPGKYACRVHAAREEGEPRTKLVAHADPNHCVPMGGLGAVATEYQDENGNRTRLRG
jgi:ABC-type microcin C transport system duplicated ATPase subunit YejF